MRRPRSRQHLRRSKLPPAQGAQLRGAWVEGSRVRRLLSRLEAGAHAWRGTGLDPRIVEHRPNSQGRRFNEAGGARGRGHSVFPEAPELDFSRRKDFFHFRAAIEIIRRQLLNKVADGARH